MTFEKRAKIQALIGCFVWIALLFSPIESGVLRQITWLLLLAILVIFPLGFSLAGKHPSIPYQVALFLQPFTAAIVVMAYFLPRGVLSGTFAIVWLPLTLFAAGHGVIQLRKRGWRASFAYPAETCLALAPLYLPIGAAWLFAARLGIEPLGFTEPVISLTAVHFHYAGFAAPILCGLAGYHQKEAMRNWRQSMFRVIAIIVILGPAFVAAGLTLSYQVEALAGVVLAFGYTGVALIMLWHVMTHANGVFARVFLGISSLTAIVTMFLAAGFALRETGLFPSLTIPQMVTVHGWGNAIGFVLCGLLGWVLNRAD
jgi:hypothetical protein